MWMVMVRGKIISVGTVRYLSQHHRHLFSVHLDAIYNYVAALRDIVETSLSMNDFATIAI